MNDSGLSENDVDVLSKTHVASSRAGGCTADHYVLRHVKHGVCTADFIWIDEYTQLDAGVLVQLNKLTYTGVRWLLSGDPHQFPAIFSSYRGCPVADDAFQRSALFHRMAGGNRVTLRECKRSNAELFDWFASLIEGGARFQTPLPQVIEATKRAFTFSGPAAHNSVVSHSKKNDCR